jgi:hypothetical protein
MLRAICEVRAHIAPGKLGAATPTAFHPRPRWAAAPASGSPVGIWSEAAGRLRPYCEVRAHIAPGKPNRPALSHVGRSALKACTKDPLRNLMGTSGTPLKVATPA